MSLSADERTAALRTVRSDVEQCRDTIAAHARDLQNRSIDSEIDDNPYWLLEVAADVLGEAVEVIDHGTSRGHAHRLTMLGAVYEIARGHPDELSLEDMRAMMAMFSGLETW